MYNNQLTAAIITTISFFIFSISITTAQIDQKEKLEKAVNNLKLRSIGPAMMGGRIADIAVHPENLNTWYVAVGSGGLWKTTNRGTTWDPVFDNEGSYSIGTVTIDPNNTEVVWVGTGENVSGRHVAWGDGVYRSGDGGSTWTNMGLDKSEHIGKILVDPRNSDIIFVAAEGPLWASGRNRGLYKSINAGKTWELVLHIDENTGVTDVEFNPANPEVMYVAAYQRRRQVWSLLAGGPESGIFKSTDAGKTWKKIKTGLPQGDVGKIGLAVTPANSNLVYATIEANDKEKGFYKSVNQGESWEKQNSYISGGTGPHYYQEIEASPEDEDLVYQMDVFFHVTRDGGKHFDYLGTGREKHSDNHALWIDPNDGNHLLAGSDAGLYETFDEGTSWRHFSNMPISQFYKLGLDNAEPFYNIIGGAQDLGTLIGPSRTTNIEGIRNQEWLVPLGADGYDSTFDPEDDHIAYMEIQGGLLHRYDKRNHEVLNIQPQPAPGDDPERWNWDSPIQVSPHNHQRIYFGSQRVWKSEDRGNSWTAISKDLTTNTNRYELETIDRVWSVDALYDNGAMSKYSTLTAISESPLVEGLLYTGSDDGKVQVTANDGSTWTDISNLPQVPERVFINDVEASVHDGNGVFVAADGHKFGDFMPYLFMSKDRGKTWKSIVGDLPKSTIVWAIRQDHIDENLLFIGTEYGLYFSPNMGVNWLKLGNGVPTIAFRDIELHTRDNDLVGATFGRGFYILDDYSPLREMSRVVNEEKSALFPIRDAWWYIPNAPLQAKGMPTLGSSNYVADNPDFGAMITYYLSSVPETSKSKRQDAEKELNKKEVSIPFPGWDQLRKESSESNPQAMLLISNENGDPINWIEAQAKKGLNRITWDLRHPALDPINLSKPDFVPPWAGTSQGPLVVPGKYSAQLFIYYDGELLPQGEKQEFKVKSVAGNDSNVDYKAIGEFQLKTSELARQASIAGRNLGEAGESFRYMKAALLKTPKASQVLFAGLAELEEKMKILQTRLYGDRVLSGMNESTTASIMSYVWKVKGGHWDTTQEPTETYKQSLKYAASALDQFKIDLSAFLDAVEEYEQQLGKAGAPYTPGRGIE
ncbi:WD40/YVTN/BNR-like repeat-containing protein [Portibacter lacus]|uniref:Glycosyl hydrolase n=1 Tax=Portibacter lacus TaxID=1099794 RepID=A0AA37STN8_9BACT|nr:glycosyl hydrolase [Portibacter lacus]GLR19105.1 hypothetical protein GCM10007940_37210 [Portibacter lacus]